MLAALLILCLLIWVPIIYYQVSHRGFFILLTWFLIAPVATNVIKGEINPFFRTPEANIEAYPKKVSQLPGGGYARAQTSIRLDELLQPTRIILSVFFAVILLNTLSRKTRLAPFDTTEIFMAIFSILLVVNVLLLSRRTAFGLKTAIDAFIIPFIAYYIIRRYVTSEDHFRKLTQTLCYLGFYLIICCLIERLTHTEFLYRLKGPLAGAGQLFLVLTIVFYAMLAGNQSISPGIYRFSLYLIPVIILLTWSRGYWLGFLAGIGVFLFLTRRFITRSRKVGGIGVALILLSMMAIGALAGQEVIEHRVANTNTIEWRLAKWNITLQETLKHPLFGIGLNNLRDIFGATMGGYTTAHNSFLSLLAELGVIGFLAYAAIIISIIRTGLQLYWTGAWPGDRWRGITLISAVIAYQIAAATITLLYVVELSQVYVYVFVGAIAGLYGAQRSKAGVGMVPRGQQLVSPEISVRPQREAANFL